MRRLDKADIVTRQIIGGSLKGLCLDQTAIASPACHEMERQRARRGRKGVARAPFMSIEKSAQKSHERERVMGS
ncbi:hypothetical protein AA102526_0511 [Asaia lannensis NBRC 102526]|nr:hypothetical protein AA102526_0511 [Asaia lannensis NBRC 102526]